MQDYRCTAFLDGWPSWIGGYGDEWLKCCQIHDIAYEAGDVTAWTHIELGQCVFESGGWILGPIMAVATLLYWLHRHVNRMNR